MILTPEQIDSFWNTRWNHGSIEQMMADTILAYAEIVEQIAEWEQEPWQCICGGVMSPQSGHGHTSCCPYLAARKLRGKQ